ncbi:MAG TPA: hypothetical protein VLM79_11970 [Kofleriaceae bacterium]|nr:hypothetical protein [Kofleriaceae bacterium]
MGQRLDVIVGRLVGQVGRQRHVGGRLVVVLTPRDRRRGLALEIEVIRRWRRPARLEPCRRPLEARARLAAAFALRIAIAAGAARPDLGRPLGARAAQVEPALSSAAVAWVAALASAPAVLPPAVPFASTLARATIARASASFLLASTLAAAAIAAAVVASSRSWIAGAIVAIAG